MEYGLIGEHLGHSFSKVIHNMLGDYSYELKELRPDEVSGFITARDFKAINVTIPYKETVMPFLDVIDEPARLIGAVNTIVNRNGKLYGYNTDFYGMKKLFEKNGIALQGKNVAILGSGGTSKTAKAVAKASGAGSIYQISRKAADGTITYAQLSDIRDQIDVIVNTTPVGMYLNVQGMPVDPEVFPKLSGVIDAIYNPLSTELIRKAKKCGIPAEGGLYMLVAQAVRAAQFFFDSDAFEEKLDDVYQRILSDKINIVLIGMPGCGKTTIGKKLAEKLGKVFIDSDDVFVSELQTTIPEFFAEHGEARFREEEARIIRNLSEKNGLLIATGGGVVTRSENIDHLKANGFVVYLNRPLSDIVCTNDRPLTTNRKALEEKYEQRKGLYEGAADMIFPVGNDAERNTEKLAEMLQEQGIAVRGESK